MHLDGRARRLQESVESFLKELREGLVKIAFDEEQHAPSLVGEALGEFNSSLIVKRRILGTLKQKIKPVMGRIEQSKNKDTFTEDTKKLEDFDSRIDTLLDFVDFIKGPVTDLDKALAQTQAFPGMGVMPGSTGMARASPGPWGWGGGGWGPGSPRMGRGRARVPGDGREWGP